MSQTLTTNGFSGWHMYLLYMGLCVVCSVLVYFLIPETKGLPMEEIAALFGDVVVVRLTEDGTQLQDGDKAGTIQQIEEKTTS